MAPDNNKAQQQQMIDMIHQLPGAKDKPNADGNGAANDSTSFNSAEQLVNAALKSSEFYFRSSDSNVSFINPFEMPGSTQDKQHAGEVPTFTSNDSILSNVEVNVGGFIVTPPPAVPVNKEKNS